MRFSTFRSSVAALAAAVAFAACSGHGLTPSTSLPGASAPDNIAGVAPFKATGPCAAPQQGYDLGGSCNAVSLKPTGGSGKLAAYKGISIAATLGSNTGKSAVLVFRDATGKGDIKPVAPNKTPFPLFGPKTCAKGGTPCTGKTFIYIEGINPGKPFQLNTTPGIKITNAGKFPGKTCFLTELTKAGWEIQPLSATVTGHTLTFPDTIPHPSTLPKGAFFITFACK